MPDENSMNSEEEFWAGDFGDDYLSRNQVQWTKRSPFWEPLIEELRPENVLEVGCNACWNLSAIKVAMDVNGLDQRELYGVDVNKKAIELAWRRGFNKARHYPARLIGQNWPNHFDLVFTAGMLIHVAPDDLVETMTSIANAAKKWVLAIEYAPESDDATRVEEVPYRGHDGKLWRCDYGLLYYGLDLGLELVRTGNAGEGFDNCTYWLLRK